MWFCRAPAHRERSAPEIERPAPLLGQHSFELLTELGITATEVESLIAYGIVVQPLSVGAPPAAGRHACL
jgi:crotonobetainyl-CoA:carnitine CoA-transferase CaiB-like acyl-CoA transferase